MLLIDDCFAANPHNKLILSSARVSWISITIEGSVPTRPASQSSLGFIKENAYTQWVVGQKRVVVVANSNLEEKNYGWKSERCLN
jgi:hypothetical protein